jgi:hypothetical protein
MRLVPQQHGSHPVLVKGRILSTHAMHTQKKWCAGVDAYDGYYLVAVRKNQPGLYQDLVDFFADKQLDGGNGSMTNRSKKGMAGEKCAKSGRVRK